MEQQTQIIVPRARKKPIYCKDMAGQRFGYLKAVESTGRRDRRNCVIWECHCTACGNEVEFSTAQLAQNISCGCVRQQRNATIWRHMLFDDGTCPAFLRRKPRSDNATGHKGISRTKHGKWKAHIGFKGERHYLGTHDTLELALEARAEAEKRLHHPFLIKHGFTPVPRVIVSV